MNHWDSMILPYFILALIQLFLSPAGPLSPPPNHNCPTRALFGPVHFTKYPLKPEYQHFNPDYVSKLHPSAHEFVLQRYYPGAEPHLLGITPNHSKAYIMDAEPPITPRPMPSSAPDLPADPVSKLWGIVYITLTGIIETIVPTSGPWSWVGKFISYLFKLAPLLWWAMPAWPDNPAAQPSPGLSTQSWFPDIMTIYINPSNLSPKTLLILGASCMFFY